jgi:hypothetical protein
MTLTFIVKRKIAIYIFQGIHKGLPKFLGSLDASVNREKLKMTLVPHVVSSIPVPAGQLDILTLSRYRGAPGVHLSRENIQLFKT